jgi:threonine dehydrogenase-like Zn-dependent dehydrogenase
MAVCQALGGRNVIAIDINEERLKFAKEYAASQTYLSAPGGNAMEKSLYAKQQVGSSVCRILLQRAATDIRGSI